MSSRYDDFFANHTDAAIHLIADDAETKRSMTIALHEEQDLPAIHITTSSNFCRIQGKGVESISNECYCI